MLLKKSKTVRIIAVTSVLVGIGFTSCKKEIDTEVQSEEKKGIETWKTLEDYPSEITLDNWEEFVYAPQAVLDHFERLEYIKNGSNSTVKSSELENIPPLTPPATLGTVLFWRGQIPVYEGEIPLPQQMVQFPGVTVSNCNYSGLSNNFEGPFNFWLPVDCPSNPSICMVVDNPGTSSNISCDMTDPATALTAFDLIIIQRHVSVLQLFTQPAQFIAADANRDGNITDADISMVKKMILGHYIDWPNSPNYLFIDESHYNNFTTLEALYATAGGSAILPCQNSSSIHRIGVKTGDVNGSLSTCFP